MYIITLYEGTYRHRSPCCDWLSGTALGKSRASRVGLQGEQRDTELRQCTETVNAAHEHRVKNRLYRVNKMKQGQTEATQRLLSQAQKRVQDNVRPLKYFVWMYVDYGLANWRKSGAEL